MHEFSNERMNMDGQNVQDVQDDFSLLKDPLIEDIECANGGFRSDFSKLCPGSMIILFILYIPVHFY